MNPTTTSFGSGRIYFHMNWGWYGTGNGWFSGNNVNPTDDGTINTTEKICMFHP